jgi:hypothetical protein
MDPFTAGVMIAIGKYVADKTVEAIPAIGTEATKLLEKMYNFIADKLSAKGTSEKVIVDGYADDPSTFEKPFSKILSEEIDKNKDFTEELQKIINEYNEIIKSKGINESYTINVKGNLTATGSVFGNGSVSAGGDIVGGNKS